MSGDTEHERVGLPAHAFFYTLDQVASMLNLPLDVFKLKYVWYRNRSTGRRKGDQLVALNIAPEDELPDWRIPEGEFIRWLRLKGIKVHQMFRMTL